MSDHCLEVRFQLAHDTTSQLKPAKRMLSAQDFKLKLDLKLPGKGITAVFGHSGSGKTTFLRCIAGLQAITKGRVIVNGSVWQDEHVLLPTHKRPLGYVFQEPSLFPHLSTKENLMYAVKRSEDRASTAHFHKVVSIMGIEPILERYPAQLSGGEKQRVAIARALLIIPRLLLMDEPLASLDSAIKQEILPYLEKLREEFNIPILYVSHSVNEIARLANHLVVLNNGSVMAHGPVSEILSQLDLSTDFGEDMGVVIDTEIVERDIRWHLTRVEFSGGELWIRDCGGLQQQIIRVRILAKDVSLALECHTDTSILNRLAAIVVEIQEDSDSAMSLIRLKIGNAYLVARITKKSAANLNITVDSKVWAQIKSVAIAQ